MLSDEREVRLPRLSRRWGERKDGCSSAAGPTHAILERKGGSIGKGGGRFISTRGGDLKITRKELLALERDRGGKHSL